MQLAELIERAETHLGGTRKLAAALGESPSNVTKWRKGERHCPDEKIIRMAQMLGLPPRQTWSEVAWHRLGKLATTSALGAVAMLGLFGIRTEDARAAAPRLSAHYV
jgi:DNA-binding transcriptional regulator YdaS (Cro superfamily)